MSDRTEDLLNEPGFREFEEIVDETGDAIDALRSRSSTALPGTASMRIRRRWHNDPGGGVTVHTAQDVQPILDHMKYIRNETDGQRSGDWGRLAGQIPMGIYMDFRRRARNELELSELIFAWMEDPDNSGFRAWTGRLGKPQ